jgi:TfoX/Sxy family transcriptional regulator of competence genes
MAYNEQLANRIREHLSHLTNIEEKEMMGGLVFMYNNKMCVGIFRGELMCRVDPDNYEDLLEESSVQSMEFGGKVMKGWILVEPDAIKSRKQMDYWIGLALEYNKKAKASKKRKK